MTEYEKHNELMSENQDLSDEDIQNVVDEVEEDLLEKIPDDVTRQIVKQSLSISKSGPLPDPTDFSKYEEVVPGAGDRILTMTEKEQDHRHSIDTKEQDKFHRNNTILSLAGIILGGVISMTGIVGGIYLAVQENAFAGAFISTISLGSIVANILKAGNKQNIN